MHHTTILKTKYEPSVTFMVLKNFFQDTAAAPELQNLGDASFNQKDETVHVETAQPKPEVKPKILVRHFFTFK